MITKKLTYCLLLLSFLLCSCTQTIKTKHIDSNTLEYSINEKKELTLKSYKYENNEWTLENEKTLNTNNWLIYNDLQNIGYGEYTKNGDYYIEYTIEKDLKGYITERYDQFDFNDHNEYVLLVSYYKNNDNPVIIEDNTIFNNQFLSGEVEMAYCITISFI